MGIYVNPGNQGFAEIVNSDYVDKTGLVSLINRTIGRTNKLVCISRPRRFGKSFAAEMLTAYYDCSCDSHELFDDKEIAKTEEYRKYLNHFNVISLDITGFISDAKTRNVPLREVPSMIQRAIRRELCSFGVVMEEEDGLADILIRCVELPEGKRFVFIIDEWDAMIREAKEDAPAQEAYLNLLRGWFKNRSFTPKVVAAAYMTGILPIKKDQTQSAISDFEEYSILEPGDFARYTGFTENDVERLCEKYEMDFEQVRTWYDGYELCGKMSVYNPFSVMRAMKSGKCRSYWKKTSAAEALTAYINMDFDGLQEIIARLIAGEEIEVETERFQNDFETFKSKDDVLTLLIHLGYLTYREDVSAVRIPNEEIRMEFRQNLTGSNVSDRWMRLIRRSQKLLDDTVAGNGDAVASVIEEIRGEQYAPQYYNDEQALRFVIKFAYIAAFAHYVKVEELPSGRGIADVVFIPKRDARLPALIIELKWNRTAKEAIGQIREKGYGEVLKDFGGEILFVGINYDERTKKHICSIEKAENGQIAHNIR